MSQHSCRRLNVGEVVTVRVCSQQWMKEEHYIEYRGNSDGKEGIFFAQQCNLIIARFVFQVSSEQEPQYIYVYVSWISMFMLLELNEPCLLVASLFKLKLVVPGGVPSAS